MVVWPVTDAPPESSFVLGREGDVSRRSLGWLLISVAVVVVVRADRRPDDERRNREDELPPSES